MGILFPAHHHPQLFIPDGVPELFKIAADLVQYSFIVLSAGKVKKALKFGGAFVLAVPALYRTFQTRFFPQRFLCFFRIVPEIGFGYKGIELFYFLLLGLKVKDSS